MDINTLRTRFQLHQLAASSHTFCFVGNLKQSAVLIPLISIEQQLHIVLTQRAHHLKHHAGQISFPGGRVDDSDINIVQTALREAYEEINLSGQNVEVIGQLQPYQTISGYIIYPIVGFIDQISQLKASPDEVADIFTVPLQHFLSQQNYLTIPAEYNERRYPVTFIPYQKYNIWGATAAILKDLVAHIQ